MATPSTGTINCLKSCVRIMSLRRTRGVRSPTVREGTLQNDPLLTRGLLTRWRKGWDSNPRCGSPHTAFPVLPVKPLLHLSGISNWRLPITSWSACQLTSIGNRQSRNRQCHGGEGGIRTHGGRKPTPVFETGALIHYATSPQRTDMSDQTSEFSLFFLTSG